MSNKTPQTIPQELKNVAKEVKDELGDKIEKCYSKERYKDFQDAVEGIIIKKVDSSDIRESLEKSLKIKETVKNELSDMAWRSKTFWIPTIISIIALIVMILIAIYKH